MATWSNGMLGNLASGLRIRSLIFCALLLLGAVVTVSTALSWQHYRGAIRETRDKAVVQARAISEAIEPHLLLHDTRAIHGILVTGMGAEELQFAMVINTKGERVAGYGRDASFVPSLTFDLRDPIPRPVRPGDARVERSSAQLAVVVPVWQQSEERNLEVDIAPSRNGSPDVVLGYACLYYSMRKVQGELADDVLTCLVVSAGVLLIGFAVTIVVVRQLIGPIGDLAAAAGSIANGDLARRASEDAVGEVGVLARSFNHMADRVRQYTEELEAQVTERTAALVDALRRAEAATVAKSEFLANMSHEIRTPMTAIIGYTDILIEKSYGRDAQEPLAVIKRNGEHLLSIINDILDLSKIEAGKLEVERIRFSPLQMIAELGSLMRVRAEAKGLALQIEFDGEMPETVEGDPTRVRQILINLLGNAIKFTEFGTIRLAVALCRRERLAALAAQPDGSGPAMLPADSEFYLRFDVIDTGIGISPEQLATLFRPFQQADGSMTRRYGGTGLGLTISRHLTGMLGGTLLVDSAVGEGSRFRVILPVGDLAGVPRVDHPGVEAVRDSHPAARTVPRISGPCRVLLAEDGPDNQRLISYVLGKAGIEVTVAENGRIAVDHVREALGRGEKYDVILMDMQMPVLDGYGATGQLRSMGYPGPIIALTAHAMASDREKCLNAGCTDYLTKPINRQDLLDRIRAYCQTVSPADVEACCTASGGAT